VVTACWSLKGGSGTTVISAGLALAMARRRLGRDVLLVDLAGDLPALLAMPEPGGPGIAEWLAAGPSVPPDALARLEEPVTSGLTLLHRGSGPLHAARGSVLIQVLAGSGRDVVVDCGNLPLIDGVSDGQSGLALQVAAEASRSLLVTRACYLAVRRFDRCLVSPSGVVVVRESARALSDVDVANRLGVPVVASVAVDPAVGRAVDCGLMVSRMPRRFAEVMGEVA